MKVEILGKHGILRLIRAPRRSRSRPLPRSVIDFPILFSRGDDL